MLGFEAEHVQQCKNTTVWRMTAVMLQNDLPLQPFIMTLAFSFLRKYNVHVKQLNRRETIQFDLPASFAWCYGVLEKEETKRMPHDASLQQSVHMYTYKYLRVHVHEHVHAHVGSSMSTCTNASQTCSYT